jgi:hypothetical protein
MRYRILDLEVKEMDSIKERVGAYLERSGSTKKQLAEEMGMPYSTFHSKLYGPSEFTFMEGKRLSEIVGCSCDEMFVSPFTPSA